MRQLRRTNGITAAEQRHHFRVIVADSAEAMELYYYEKKRVLEDALKQMTLQDDAQEITLICREISRIKQELKTIADGRMSAANQLK